MSLAPETESLYSNLGDEVTWLSSRGDIRDQGLLASAIVDFKPDFVFHLAAQPLVRDSYERPIYTYETNVIGTANVILATRGLKRATWY